jgi:ribosomal protein L29
MVKTKAYELRKQQPDALQKQLKDLKTELAGLRVAQVNAGTPTKLGQM